LPGILITSRQQPAKWFDVWNTAFEPGRGNGHEAADATITVIPQLRYPIGSHHQLGT
jgi:hypothetical protein